MVMRTVRIARTRLVKITATITAVGLTAACPATVPDYTGFDLMIRSNFADAYRLPDGVFFANATPALNDAQQVAVKLDVISGTDAQGVWAGDVKVGEIAYQTSPFALVSDPSINSAGYVVFEQTFSLADGLYFHDIDSGDSGLETTLPIGASSWAAPSVNDTKQIGYRAKFGFSGQAYYSYDGISDADLHAAEVTLIPDSPYSFLFTPAFNNARQIAGKARLGGPGDVGDEQPDQIRIFEADQSSTLIVEDVDGDPASPFDKFDNSVALTDDGRVAFIATRIIGGRGVYISDGATTIEIATTDDPQISDIEFFHPAVNNDGLVAFRAFDSDGLRAVWVGDGTTLRRVIAEHDLIECDLGLARIDQNDNSPVFGGSMTINDNGDVAFHCALTPEDNNQIEWGSAIYVARAGKTGDVNGDGVVDVDDLFSIINAWGPCDDPNACPEDLNDDGIVDINDLFVVLNNWG
jgi:hypothetical protein